MDIDRIATAEIEIVEEDNAGDYRLISKDTNDETLVKMWVTRKNSLATRKQYQQMWGQFRREIGLPLQKMKLADLQRWQAGITGSQNTKKVRVACVKSLFTFAQKIGYIKYNVAAMLDSIKVKNDLAERILTEEEVMSMITLTTKTRDKMLIRLLYASAGRISEIAGLTWTDIKSSGDSGQVTLFGKGGKTRAVKLSKSTWNALQDFKIGSKNCLDSDPVFRSQKGGPLDETMIHRIVKAAAKRAGIPGNVSAHWLRHSHASHALHRGADISLVRDTLGHRSLDTTNQYIHAMPNQSSALHLIV